MRLPFVMCVTFKFNLVLQIFFKLYLLQLYSGMTPTIYNTKTKNNIREKNKYILNIMLNILVCFNANQYVVIFIKHSNIVANKYQGLNFNLCNSNGISHDSSNNTQQIVIIMATINNFLFCII